jgi:hypothetical protein
MSDGRTTRMTTDVAISVMPANEASWDDLQTVFGARGDASHCQCQQYKIRDFAWRSVPVEERTHRLREQTAHRGQQAYKEAGRDADRLLEEAAHTGRWYPES